MFKNRQYKLSIADIIFSLETDHDLIVDNRFIPFFTENKQSDFRIYFREVEKLPEISDKVVYEDLCYRVHPDGKGGFIRSFFDALRDREAYAVTTYDIGHGNIRVDYLKKGARCVSEMQNSFFHITLESLLLAKKCLCLHASCVETMSGGLLFSGVSGIGKSTQAALWQQYRGAKQINGDRPILKKGSDGWEAWGSPYAGSSKCHVNAGCRVSAIIMLRKAKTLSLKKLSSIEAFRSVWSGITVHSWDKTYVKEASNLVMDLISEAPVFLFDCTPNEDAVNYLEMELRKECCL